MSQLVGAVIGAIAVVSIPLVAWFSRRATREGRLLVRVERLGSAYGVMPASSERGEFEQHLRRAIAHLNDWLDTEKRARRRLQRQISGIAYVVGVLAVFVAIPLIGPGNSVATSILGIVVGSLISIVGFGSTFLLERSATRQAEAGARAEAAAAERVRLDALRRGERPSPQA